MIILSLDPGETTGYCICESGPLKHDEWPTRLIEHGTFPLWQGIEGHIGIYHPEVIVYEAFRLFPWKAQAQSFNEFPSAQVIGVIKYLAEKYSRKTVAQGAAYAKSIKRIPLRLGTPHATDAYRHATHYLRSII